MSDSAPLAVTIGNFDGVHLGHQAILERLKAHARAAGATPAVVTFDPHPQAVLRGHAPLALVTAARRTELLEEAGIDRVLVIPFDRSLSLVEPQAFVSEMLVRGLGVRAVVVGEKRLVSAISVGTNPTYGEHNPVTLEAYALDFEGDLYGEEGDIEFAAHLRPEQAFPSEAELAAAIKNDVAEVRRLLSR